MKRLLLLLCITTAQADIFMVHFGRYSNVVKATSLVYAHRASADNEVTLTFSDKQVEQFLKHATITAAAALLAYSVYKVFSSPAVIVLDERKR